jgi:C1A family cysteine protease
MFRLIVCLALIAVRVSAAPIDRFYKWVEENKIELPESDSELLRIFTNWKVNDRIIEETNAKNLTYTLGHNVFSGMDANEFAEHMHFGFNRELFSIYNPSLRGVSQASPKPESIPSSIDWRAMNAVTPVKNQKACGSCWAFSTTGALEGIYAIKQGILATFSEQQLVDCDYVRAGGSSMGCSGGNMGYAMDWIGKNNGLCTEEAYPYVSGDTSVNGPCQKSCSVVCGSDVISTVAVSRNSDSAMMAALAQQPVSVAIEAAEGSFQLYKSGVFTGSCGTSIDHGVLLVGYGTMNGLDYYIMKNSWGVEWGDKGYMYMGRGNDPATGKPYNGGKGQCAVLTNGIYPVI